MTEQLKIPSKQTGGNQNPTGGVPVLEKGEDGYYTINARLQVQAEGAAEPTGLVHTLIKINEVPEGIDISDPNAIRIHLHPEAEGVVTYPTRGFVVKLTVASIDTSVEGMLINLITDQAAIIQAMHLDHIPFVQHQTGVDQTQFLNSRPGEKFFITVEFITPSSGPQQDDEVSDEATDLALPAPEVLASTTDITSNKLPQPSEEESEKVTAPTPEPTGQVDPTVIEPHDDSEDSGVHDTNTPTATVVP